MFFWNLQLKTSMRSSFNQRWHFVKASKNTGKWLPRRKLVMVQHQLVVFKYSSSWSIKWSKSTIIMCCMQSNNVSQFIFAYGWLYIRCCRLKNLWDSRANLWYISSDFLFSVVYFFLYLQYSKVQLKIM